MPELEELTEACLITKVSIDKVRLTAMNRTVLQKADISQNDKIRLLSPRSGLTGLLRKASANGTKLTNRLMYRLE